MNRRGFIGAMAGAAALAGVPVATNAKSGSWPSMAQAIETAFNWRERGRACADPIYYAHPNLVDCFEVRPGDWDSPETWTAIRRPMRTSERAEVARLAILNPVGVHPTKHGESGGMLTRGYVARPALEKDCQHEDCPPEIQYKWQVSITDHHGRHWPDKRNEYVELMAKHRASGVV